MDLIKEFKAVRAVGVPVVAVKSSNQPDTIRALAAVNDDTAAVRWDAVRGLVGFNKPGLAAVATALDGGDATMTIDLTAALEACGKMPDGTVVYLVNAHRFIDDPRVSTGIGNLREPYKAAGSTCVLLGPAFRFPDELLPDVVILDDPLPGDPKLNEVVDFVLEQAAVGALRGLSSFGAEQQAFLSLRRNGGGNLTLDLTSLWARKIEAINAIPGLYMEYGKTAPGGIRGLAALREMLDSLFAQTNPERPGACLHIDEIEKAIAGFGRQGAGDSSGVTQDQVGQILQYMEDRGWGGIICAGGPGTGKSLVSKTAAGLYGVPYLRLDLGGLKGSLVGESEQRIRAALETVDRVAAGRVLVMATCNRMEALPPELRRRFTEGIWYFDLPCAEDRAEIWELYRAKFSIKEKAPSGKADWSAGWTGAEIRNVCRAAWRLQVSLDDARRLIVPIHESGKEDIERLRQAANGRFLDAARGGKYIMGAQAVEPTAPRRKVEVN